MLRIAINGFGRIGRCITRAYAEMSDNEKSMMKIVAINSNKLTSTDAAHMLKYDSVHGRMSQDITTTDEYIHWGDESIVITSHSNPSEINWKKYEVDVVLECSGMFRTKEEASQHIHNGAKYVIVSAPCKNADATVVMGANDNNFYAAEGSVLSIGSCTTNCLGPVVKILHDEIGIENAFMTTIHAYTNDQSTLDSRHSDLRRGRAASISMVPTSTGAANMIGEIIPLLKGKIDGIAVRVPVPNVSMIDLTFNAMRETSADEINDVMRKYSELIPNILNISSEELISVDFNHTSYSAIFDTTQTRVVDDKLCRIVAWYDNEWGFSYRMLDLCAILVHNR